MIFSMRFSGRSGLGMVSVGLPILMFIILSVATPNFLTQQNLFNVNSQITALLLVAFGQLMVALIGGIDISVGSVISLTSVVIVSVNPDLALPAATVLGAAVGLANGLGVVLFGVHPLIMTLASMTFVQGLALLIRSGAGGVVPAWIGSLARSEVLNMPSALVWCLLTLGLVCLLLYGTRFGLRLFAIGANAHSTALSGVGVNMPRIVCYILSSLSAVLAGIYLTARISTGDPMLGQSFGLDSVTAIALGGVQLAGGAGSVLGAVLGTITMGLITNGMNLLGISPFLRAALTGLLLLGAVSLQKRKAIGI